ncbi:MAG: hypothetical protein AB7G13_05285 [Lautropia sp.]
MIHAHRPPEPDDPEPGRSDRPNDWPDREPHEPDEVREPPRPRRSPIEEPRTPAS